MKPAIFCRWCIFALLGIALSSNAQIQVIPNMGPIPTCSGTIHNFETGYASAAHMSWAVSGEAEIVSVSGMDVSTLKSGNGVPSTAKLQTVYASVCSWTGSLKGTFKLANGGTQTYSLTGDFNANFGNSKALGISVLFPVAEYASVSWNGSMGFCGTWGQQGGSLTMQVQGSSLPAAANIYTNGFDPDNVPCKQNISLGTDWVAGANYEWSISPAGAVINGPANTTSLNISSFTNPGIYNVSLKLFDACGKEKVYQKTLNVPGPPNINLPTNILSCDNTVEINPIVTGGQAPYTVHWIEYMDGYFQKGTYYTTTSDFSNTFIATKYGNSTIKVKITGANGCHNTASANIATLGGYSDESPDVSGWLSGHINPSARAAVSSNLVKAPDHERIYFVELNSSTGDRQVKFYEFSGDKWILKNAGINDVNDGGDNSLKYFRGNLEYDFIFYINSSHALTARSLDRMTGQAIGKQFVFTPIIPTGLSNAAYHIQYLDGNYYKVFWKDLHLYSQVIQYNSSSGSFSIVPGTMVTIAEVDLAGSFNDLVRYEVDENRGKVFYFKADGGFYYKNLDDITQEYKLNGIFSGDFVLNISDIAFDNDGIVYFAAGGDIYFAKFDSHNNYLGTFKIETTDGINNLTFKSEAKGYFAINSSTNVIYYAGGNENIYQIFRKPDFATSNAFGIVKATPNTFSDKVSSSLIFEEPHLFYRSMDNQVHNLFYTVDGQVSCKPAYLKLAENDYHVDHLNPASSTTIHSTQIHAPESSLSGTLFPNPFTDFLAIDVEGQGKGTIELIESSGRTVMKQAYDFTPTQINTADLVPGIYFCKVSGENVSSVVFKVVKN